MKRWWMAVALVGLLVGGCSSDGEPDEASPSSTAESTSVDETSSGPGEATSEPTATATEAGVTAPEMPAGAREDSPEGAIAFVEHWVVLMNHAIETGDAGPLGETETGSCVACSALVDEITTSHEQGGVGSEGHEGGGWSASGVDVVVAEGLGEAGQTVVSATISVEAESVPQPDGSVSQTAARTLGVMVWGLERSGAGWEVAWVRATAS